MLGTAMKPALGKSLPCPSTRSPSTISSSPLSSSYSDTCYVNSPPVSLTDHARSSLASRSSLELRHKKASHVHGVLSPSPNGSIRGFNVTDLKESSQPSVALIGAPQGLLKKCFASQPTPQTLQVWSRWLLHRCNTEFAVDICSRHGGVACMSYVAGAQCFCRCSRVGSHVANGTVVWTAASPSRDCSA